VAAVFELPNGGFRNLADPAVLPRADAPGGAGKAMIYHGSGAMIGKVISALGSSGLPDYVSRGMRQPGPGPRVQAADQAALAIARTGSGRPCLRLRSGAT
jgi:hypothetical protein